MGETIAYDASLVIADAPIVPVPPIGVAGDERLLLEPIAIAIVVTIARIGPIPIGIEAVIPVVTAVMVIPGPVVTAVVVIRPPVVSIPAMVPVLRSGVISAIVTGISSRPTSNTVIGIAAATYTPAAHVSAEGTPAAAAESGMVSTEIAHVAATSTATTTAATAAIATTATTVADEGDFTTVHGAHSVL